MAEELRLAIGGPLHRIERAAHAESLRRLVPLLVAITWGPLVVFALLRWARTGMADSLIRDLSVHARLLVAMPLFLIAERLLDRVARVTMARLFDEGYVPPGSVARVRALVASVARWRDAALPESIMLVGAVAAGAFALIGWIPPAGAIHGLGQSRYDAVRIWYGLAALPLFQFLMWRSLFRWALWIRVLFGLARVPLRLLPAHADRRGGIGFVKTPSLIYGAVILLATSAVLCAGWATQISVKAAPLATFRAPFIVFVILGLVVAFLPHVVFTPQLLRARIVGLREFGALVSDYTERFGIRWLARENRGDVLGTPDLQSLADLTSTYQHNIEQLGIVLFSRADWGLLLAAALLPAIPVLFLQGPGHEVVKRIVRILVGTMP
jgi:hypothetical protein